MTHLRINPKTVSVNLGPGWHKSRLLLSTPRDL